MVNNAGDYEKHVRKPSFVSQKTFSRNFVTIHEIKSVLMLYKPIYVGFSILDLRKLLMYEFHCKYIGTKYDNSTKLLFTDLDSIVYKTESDDVYEHLYENKNLFDFRTIQMIHIFLIPSMKK